MCAAAVFLRPTFTDSRGHSLMLSQKASHSMAAIPELTPFELTRAFTILDRSGVVTDTIRACEAAWGTEFSGNVGAVDAVKRAPGYREYVQALQASLPFPLTLYRVMSA